MSLRSADGPERTWRTEPLLGDTSSFRVTLADLDGEGRDEVMVGTIDQVSNGMAVQYWSLCVLDARRADAQPPCVALEDHPFYGMATRAAGERGCRVLETHWRWGKEAKRGDGLYLTGRWLAYRGGTLVPDARRPLVARRYLYGFAAARRDVIENARSAPVTWWRDPGVRVVRCPDPLCEASPR
jgi:hypothetical protein